MPATARLPKRAAGLPVEALPDPMPRPPSRPPGEPIIIKDPSRRPEAPELDRPLDEEDEPEIEKLPPEIIPEQPPPPAPWDRADRPPKVPAAVRRDHGT